MNRVYIPAREPEPVWNVDDVGEKIGGVVFVALLLFGMLLVGKATLL